MLSIKRKGYLLLLSYNPSEIFDYYNVSEMHGLNKLDCEAHINNKKDSYIAGWCNLIPNKNNKTFVFINLSRCNNDTETLLLINHELMHQSFFKYKYDEEIISWAEIETLKVFKIIKLLTSIPVENYTL